MREHDKKNCSINDQVYDTPPEHDCGHPVMEGPGINPDGSIKPNPNGQTVRKDQGRFGPGMKDERPIPKVDGKVIRKDSAAGGPGIK
ncbi:MAG: hypothetical protein ACLSX5_15405 [Lachnospiraceae bacterium]